MSFNILKDRYKLHFEQLRKDMNEFDPCGLVALDCPVDEYDYLTNKILSLRYQSESRENIKQILLFELENHFGEKYRESHSREPLEQFLDKIEMLAV